MAIIGTAVVALPFLHPGFPSGHDSNAHLTYTYLFDAAFQQHQFPVRWIEWVRSGFSQPVFNFYQPGLYYLIETTHLAIFLGGGSLLLSLKFTIIGMWWLGAAFMFLLCRPLCRLGGLLPATLAAALFALSPYLMLDAWVRAAYPELAAIALAPGVLWSIDAFIRTGRRRYLIALAILTSLMLLCHLPSTLIFTPVFAAYIAMHAPQRAPALLAAGMAGLAMAAFYVWPALSERHLIQMQALTHNYFDFHHHFVYPSQWITYAWGYGNSGDGPHDGMSFQISIVQWAIIIATATAIAAGRWRGRGRARALMLWCGVIAFAMVMMTSASMRIWEAFTALAFIQFPWRFLMLIPLASSILAATLLGSIRSPRTQAMIVLIVVAAQLLLTHSYLAPARYIPPQAACIDKPGWRYSAEADGVAFYEQGYFPAGASRLPASGVDVGRWTIEEESAKNGGTVQPLLLKDDRLLLDVASPRSGMRLSINSHAFPGWSVRIDGAETAVSVQPASGYMLVDVPPGRHHVEAALANTSTRSRANLVSAIGVAAVLSYAGYLVVSLLHERRVVVGQLGDHPSRRHHGRGRSSFSVE